MKEIFRIRSSMTARHRQMSFQESTNGSIWTLDVSSEDPVPFARCTSGMLPGSFRMRFRSGNSRKRISDPCLNSLDVFKYSRLPELTNLKDTPPGIVNIAPKKTARTPNPESTLQDYHSIF